MLKFKKKQTAEPNAANSNRPKGNPQGITVRGNALRGLALKALLVAVIPAALGFSYLVLVREPSIQSQQVERVSASFAMQQATNIQRLLDQFRQRVTTAANSTLARTSLTGPGDRESLAALEGELRHFFPQVTSIKVIPIGEMGTADFGAEDSSLRNHIEVDMVRRTSIGETTMPESYKVDKRWLTSMTSLVADPDAPGMRAVILATIDNRLLAQQLESLDTGAGRFVLQQLPTAKGAKNAVNIAAAGDGDETGYSQYADIPESYWRVTFTPSGALLDSMGIKPTPLLTVLVVTLLAAMAALAMVLLLFPKALAAEVDRIVAAADKKSPLELAVPELVDIAKQLRRATLRSVRRGAAEPASAEPDLAIPTGAAPGADLTNPMFQAGSIIDGGEEVLELDLVDSDHEEPRLASPEGFPEHIFRAYDIRGDAEVELTDEMVFAIGKAIGTMAGEMGEQTLIVGCDGRTSSPRIKSTLVRALMDSGRDVIDIDLVPTPLLYFATRHLDCRSGVMVTGSHNPAHHNGMKVVLNQQTIAAGGIQKVRNTVIEGRFSKGTGRMIREDIIPAYTEEVLQDIAIAMPLKVVIDAGNGATSDIAPDLFEDLGCEVIRLYCKVDGTFPNHPPDTSDESNLRDLSEAVLREEADFGVAFDGDGDRLAVVTGSGKVVRSDILLMIFAQDVVSRNPGADVVFDVKCSRYLNDLITDHGGRPVLWKTGHAFMKEKMAETGALLGGEFSGHMFFGERWYGFDDGMYAAGRLAEILSTLGQSLDDTIATFPSTVNTPEILVPVAEDKKFRVMDNVVSNADFSSGKINTMDGLRVDFQDGWGLLRASNTSPALTARFEAQDEETLELIKEEFRTQLALAQPGITITF
jgi:phosphomannomutase/phosphoglucomutase